MEIGEQFRMFTILCYVKLEIRNEGKVQLHDK